MHGNIPTAGSQAAVESLLISKLTLGLSSKKPMTVNLAELSPSDAAAFATKEFISVSPRSVVASIAYTREWAVRARVAQSRDVLSTSSGSRAY